jgi:importin subunit alpha-6/7
MRLVELLTWRRDTVLVPALRTVGNIVTGTDEQTQAVLNCNALQALHAILSNNSAHKKSIIKEACWTVSNITAGTREQIEAVIESGCIEPIVHLLKTGTVVLPADASVFTRFPHVQSRMALPQSSLKQAVAAGDE